MKKTWLYLSILLLLIPLYAGKGKVRVASDPSGAYVYVDGKKKAMTGEGFTSILLEEGDYTIKVVKPIDEKYEYIGTKKVFVGEETSVKLNFKLARSISMEWKEKKAQEKVKKDAIKLARWKKKGNIVADTKLGLMWQDDRGAAKNRKNWNDAKQYCQNLSLGGYSDWRMPNYTELLTIVDYDRHEPAIIPSFKNVTTQIAYFSSSTYPVGFHGPMIIFFDKGTTSSGRKKYDCPVRCVRNGK